MSTNQRKSLGGSVILENVAFSGISTANIQDPAGAVMGASSSTVPLWVQGNTYVGTSVCSDSGLSTQYVKLKATAQNRISKARILLLPKGQAP